MRKTNEAAAMLILLPLTWWLVGCSPEVMRRWQASRRQAAAAKPSPPVANDGARDTMLVQLRIMGIEVPGGAASDSEDIWSYVDEEAALAGSPALGRNGFRVGVARREHWPSLERIFRQLAGQQARDVSMPVLPNVPLPITLQPQQPAQTIFVYRADGTLSGQDYPPASNVLTLLCALNLDESNQLIVIGQPQLHATNDTAYLAEDRGAFVWVKGPRVYELRDLAFRLSVRSGDILVVGPGPAVHRPTSAARRFLIKDRDGIEFETVLLLMPSVVRGEARPAAAATLPAGAAG
jgi:hypothetical protein